MERILETKRREVAAAKAAQPMASLRAALKAIEPPRDFFAAVAGESAGGVRLIAEIKKASPSAGLIVPDFDPVKIARIYADHGAAALSVLTDEHYFQGRLALIREVKRAVGLPVLRKDFLFDPYQIVEARAAEADAVLLIAEALGATQVQALAREARQLGMAVLVEVHAEASLRSVLDRLGPPGPSRYILGVNNRDLADQRTDSSTVSRLARHLPAGTPFVAESGLSTRRDVMAAKRAGACAVLVGESLLRASDIGAQLDALLGRRGEHPQGRG